MSFLRNKFVKTMLVLVAAVVVLAALAHFGNNPVQRALNTAFAPVYSAAERVITPVRRFCSNVKNAPEYEKRIAELEGQKAGLEIENRSREEYIKENKRLKELLDIRDGMQNYATIGARVVSYEPNSWYDTVMLSKGSKSGINKGDVVITTLGVVGKVSEVGANWSKVSTILNISNSLGVKLTRTGDIGVVSGDAGLAEDKKCKLEYLSNDKNLIKGDILVTSGLGGVYPPDLAVGRVTEIRSDTAGNLEYGIVEPSVDFSSLYEVLVITYGASEKEQVAE